jgi:hypothetical protein
MGLLRDRRFWIYTSLAAAGLAAAGLYLLVVPPPTPYNLLLDLFGFGMTFLGGLAIISQFILPVQTMRERERAFEHFLNYVFGAYGAIIFVKDGKLVARKEELRKHGQGLALVDAASAIVLEREYASRAWLWSRTHVGSYGGPPLIRAAGPGIVFIAPGERIVATLDLRKQSRGQPAKALTRDGIEVSANVSVTFGLDSNPDQAAPSPEPRSAAERIERNRPAYSFNPTSAFRAVYGTAIGEKQPVEWTDLPVTVAVETFRNLLAEHAIDELFQPTVSNVYPFADFTGRVTRAVKEAPVLRERGILVYTVGVGALKLPREVVNQRVRTWQARWQKAALQQDGAADSQTIKTLGRWQARAQETIIKDLLRRLTAATSEVEKQTIAYMVAQTLHNAVRESSSVRRASPFESLGDSLQGLLK